MMTAQEATELENDRKALEKCAACRDERCPLSGASREHKAA